MVGDVHGDWKSLTLVIDHYRPDAVIQVGDFGYWPNCQTIWPPPKFDAPIYFCDGNHEDHWSLASRKSNEVAPNVFYQPRGSVKDILGKKFLFFGGASSIDKNRRTLGIDWFPEEVASISDLYNLEDTEGVKIVISHTAPSFLTVLPNDTNDPTRQILDEVFEKVNPKKWFFGHYHWAATFNERGCEFSLLKASYCASVPCGKGFIKILSID